MIRVRLFLMLPLLAVLSVGCSGKGNVPASVSGTVKYKGELVTAGTVNFISQGEGGGTSYPASIGPDGTYSAIDVPEGEMTVTVETQSADPNMANAMSRYGQGGRGQGGKGGEGAGATGDPEKQKGGSVSPKGKDYQAPSGAYVKIPLKYSVPTTTDLKTTLKKGKNEYNIELKD
jgi:hypothetical protein